MVNIGIYVEPVGTGIGGSETVVAVLAEALAKNHQVDLLHHIPSLSAEHFAESSGTDLKNVTLRYVERNRNPTLFSRRNPMQHYLASRRLHAPREMVIETCIEFEANH